MSNNSRLEELAQRLADRARELRAEQPKRPTLSVVSGQALPKCPDAILAESAKGMDVIVRESHCKMIRHYRRRWGMPMQEIIDQACFGHTSIEALPDDELLQLHKDMERAQDCMRDGVSFEDAGLLRTRFG